MTPDPLAPEKERCSCGNQIFVDDHCVDCWPGYDNCARPGCGHYRCEHIFPGTTFKVVYDKYDADNVGEKFSPEIGCMVQDGVEHCVEFVEPEGSRALQQETTIQPPAPPSCEGEDAYSEFSAEPQSAPTKWREISGEALNRAYKFMHEWWKRSTPNPEKKPRKMLKIRRNRIASLLAEYGAAEAEAAYLRGRAEQKAEDSRKGGAN